MMSFSQIENNNMNISNTKDTNTIQIKPWIVCLTASLFFLYEFIQINIFNSIDPEVMKDFHLDATQLGLFSSCYFYSTVGFLLPAGQILDRFSAKKVILVTLMICIIGIVGFASSANIISAAIFRLLEGIGSAFCFLGSFRIACRWFLPERMSFVTGVIVTIGMIGGAIAQAPLAILVELAGWRDALLLDAMLGLFFAVLIFANVQDFPERDSLKEIKLHKSTISYWDSLRSVYLVRHNWFCGIYTCLLNLPLVLLGALWGNLYLQQAHHFQRTQASEIVMMLFVGMIVGSPFAGYITDYIREKNGSMFLGAFFSIIVSLLIIYSHSISYPYFLMLFFLMGLFSSTQILGYPAAAEKNTQILAGMSASVVSFTTMSGYIIFQPLFGWMMDIKGKSSIVNGVMVYDVANYQHALLIIPVSLGLAAIVTMLMKKSGPPTVAQ